MKRLLSSLAALSLSAAIAIPALADVAKPTVREGDFFCFRGMPAEQINVLPPLPKRPIMRVDKIGNSKFDNTDGHDLREIRIEGDYRVLVVLVEFSDVKMRRQWGEPKDLVNEMLNGKDFNFQDATGSANDYYMRVSQGQFNPIFDVVGPVQLSKKEIDYVTSNPNDTYIDQASGKPITVYPAGRMVEEAVKSLEDEVDFTLYDSDKDGMVDFVYFFFAGQGATTGGDRIHNIWPHAYTLNSAIGAPVEVDGVKVNRYCTSSEIGSNNKLSGIGTFCHEFGHVLGFPDLYDTANNNGTVSKCFSPGSFSNMDAGNYNNNEHTPPFLSSYEQYAMEWLKPNSLSGTGYYTMLPLEARPYGYQVVSSNNPQEYFMLEARGNSFLDKYLSGHGLLVWHIDFDLGIWQNNVVNNTPEHQRIDIIEADNSKSESTRNGDPFPGASGICEFTKSVTPAFKDWKGSAMGYDLREIGSYFDGTACFFASGSQQMIPEAVLAAPAPKVVAASANEIEIEWPAVENANGYFVSVFDASKFNGSLLPYEAYFDGWYFRNIGNVEPQNGFCSATLSDLPANASCGIMVYAVNDLNASRMSLPIMVSTVDGSDFETASTNLRLLAGTNEVVAEWDIVENADSYELLIVDRKAGDTTSSLSQDFDDNSFAPGWDSNGTRFESRKFGNAAPSLKIEQPSGWLESKIYDEQISELSFWARKNYADQLCELEIYSLDKNGNPTLAYNITNLERDGSVFNLPMPANSYGVRFVYNFRATDLFLYLDDIKLDFHAGHNDTPVANAEINYNDASAIVKGLEEGHDYVAYLYPVKDSDRGAKSNEILFRVENLEISGVEGIIGEENLSSLKFHAIELTIVPNDMNASYDIFSTDGTAIATNTKGATTLPARGIYIIRSNGKATKIVL